MASPILQTVALGAQWPTLDPFLFCAHHRDDFPAGNGALGPLAVLTGRSIGQDFAGIDGWNMYHGTTIPGFPQHPHRGFETITYLRRGWCDHADSLGARARFGQGDAQWLTAGSGIVHSEMFPLFDRNGPNPLHLFQIWLNLPAKAKMVSPYFSMLWREDLPCVEGADGAVEATLIAGALDGHRAPSPPPDSWAAEPGSDVAIWHISMHNEVTWQLPAAGPGLSRVLYFFEGESLDIGAETIPASTGAVLRSDETITVCSHGPGAEFMILQGRPIGEKVAQYGPFVMNDEDQLRQAFEDYRRTQFGGWPWPDDAPVHGPEVRRFARHGDGRVDLR